MIKLSVCIITKNEEKRIERCLRALMAYDLEIVVVDTGSTDKTKEISGKYTDKVFEFPWIDDFAAAKNFAVNCASNNLVMIIDSDEYMRPADVEQIIKTIENNEDDVGRIKRFNSVTRDGQGLSILDYTNRVFDRRLYAFSGRIHEQVVRKDGKKYKTYISGIIVDHDGYEGTEDERRTKASRNTKLLLEELKDNPNDPYILYQLGKSCFMAGEYEKAVLYFEKVLEIDVDTNLEYVIDLVTTYGYTLLRLERYGDALRLDGVYDIFGMHTDFCFMMSQIYMNNELFAKAISSLQKARENKNALTVGADSFLAWYNEGVIRELTGDRDGALSCYKNAGQYYKALERIEILKQGGS